MLVLIPSSLRDNQIFFTAGGFLAEHRNKCLCIRKGGIPQELPYLRSNAEETDLRIWLHCMHSTGSRKMLYSPDTDVYNIGLPIMQENHSLEIYIELKGRRKDSHRYLHLNKFIQALHSDPDLAQVSPEQRASIVQAVYILTGCDYISYFKGIGKVFFLNVLFQHATFITGGINPSGSLAQLVCQENSHLGQLAFVRLVGCAYFKKHLAGFKFDTPEALFHSITIPSTEQQHKEWLDIIRTIVWERSYDECHYVPSYEALLGLHWKRCTWVARYWGQATENEIRMPG